MKKKTGYSQSWFGAVNHYDKSGRKTGHSVPTVFGGMKHYDEHRKKDRRKPAGIVRNIEPL